MVTIKINKHLYDIPTKWEEVKLRQYIDLATYGEQLNHTRVLSIFTGLDHDLLCNAPCDDFLLKVIPEMNFLNEEINVFALPRCKKITIGKYIFDTILEPSKETVGQKLQQQQIVNNAIENSLPHYTMIAPTIANYYAPYINAEKKWVEADIKKFEALVLEMKLIEAYPEANFFLNGYLRYLPKKVKL